jgi:type IV secretory pathway VirB2 component (pilin)
MRFFKCLFVKAIFMKTQTKDLSVAWQVCFLTMLSAVIVMMPDMALATDTPIGNVLCTVKDWFTGNTGKGLATIAITIIGIGALLGKVSWGMAIIVGIGVAIVFGAAGIVDSLNAGVTDASTGCSTGTPPTP